MLKKIALLTMMILTSMLPVDADEASIGSPLDRAILAVAPGATAPTYDGPPSQAALALLAQFGHLSPVHFEALDRLAAPLRGNLATTLHALTLYVAAAEQAFAPGTTMDLAPLEAARAAVLATLPALQINAASLTWTHTMTVAPGPFSVSGSHTVSVTSGPSASLVYDYEVRVPGLLAIDLGATNDFYGTDYAIIIDDGGDDVYHNNAGGNGMGLPCAITQRAAALIDLGGNDRYGDPANPRNCGANGGGMLGAGMLVDGGGSDQYVAGSLATNGGSFTGSGLLVDADGDDLYVAGEVGTNGGSQTGSAFLYDGAGNDEYVAAATATNGGANQGGHGRLIDAGGTDSYRAIHPGIGGAQGTGVNGGGVGAGVGLLLDLGGSGDSYMEDAPGAGDPTTTSTDTSVPTKGTGAQVDI
jgi:hypothetical protein